MPPNHHGTISDIGFRISNFEFSTHLHTVPVVGGMGIPNSSFLILGCVSIGQRQRVLGELLRVLEVLWRLLTVDHMPLDPVLFAQGVEALPKIAV